MRVLLFFGIVLIQVSAGAQSIHETGKLTGTENTLIPEGIAVDPISGNVYVSSIAHRKIVFFDATGKYSEFIGEHEFGYDQGVGMKIDERRQILWTLSNAGSVKNKVSKIIGFGLQTKRPTFSLQFSDTASHFLNDLVLVNGTLFITDTDYGAVYTLKAPYTKLELLVHSPLLDYANGITFDGSDLLVATYRHGIVRLSPSGEILGSLAIRQDSVYAHGIDGMVYADHRIWGIYNSGGPDSVSLICYSLDKSNRSVIQSKIFPLKGGVYHEPTTFAMKGQRLYVLANSHLQFYNQNKESIQGIETSLTPLMVILIQWREEN